MESFVMSETAKYLYLAFHPAPGPFDFFVFSTEGHLFPVLPSADLRAGNLQQSHADDRAKCADLQLPCNSTDGSIHSMAGSGADGTSSSGGNENPGFAAGRQCAARTEGATLRSSAWRAADADARTSCALSCIDEGDTAWHDKVRRSCHHRRHTHFMSGSRGFSFHCMSHKVDLIVDRRAGKLT